jgi:hypothetical protein
VTSSELRQAIADAGDNPEALTRLVYQEHRAARDAAGLVDELRASVKSAEEQKNHAERLLAARDIAHKEQGHAERKEQKADEAKYALRKKIEREIGLLCGGVWMARTLLSTFYAQLAGKLTRMGATNRAEFDEFFREMTDPANFRSDKHSVAFANKIEQILLRRNKLS